MNPQGWRFLRTLPVQRALSSGRWVFPLRRSASRGHAAIIPSRVTVEHRKSSDTQEIYLASDQLERAKPTVDTVIHEIAHHTSGAEDLEQAHSTAMTQVAARVVELTASRQFDDFLKEALW